MRRLTSHRIPRRLCLDNLSLLAYGPLEPSNISHVLSIVAGLLKPIALTHKVLR